MYIEFFYLKIKRVLPFHKAKIPSSFGSLNIQSDILLYLSFYNVKTSFILSVGAWIDYPIIPTTPPIKKSLTIYNLP